MIILRCARLLFFRKIDFEFLEGAAPTHTHAVASGLESFLFLFSRVMWRPADGEFGFAAGQFLKCENRMHFERPRSVTRVARGAALFVGKRIDEVEPLRWDDFAVDELAPHRRSIGRRHSVEIRPADAQIHLGREYLEALGTPPLLHVFGISETFPHEFARGIQHTRYD